MSGTDTPVTDARHGSGSRNRQRQRLIDACISALHIHGPSRTTVEKVVAIANLSPGIVRFYFRSKAAMLVASLQYLATEFDEKVLVPVTALRETPVAAMLRLVDLYLDPELASPRKVSVWYAFWGEATSRQEYYEICGQKDDSFVALVRDLMARLVARSGAAHLDTEALSLGFIGLLEVLWQGFAFQSEADIDRTAARERCYAYLRSLFPGQFDRATTVDASGSAALRARADTTGSGLGQIASGAQYLCHENDVAAPGDAITTWVAGLPVVLLRALGGELRAFTNRCQHAPHDLLPPGRHRGLTALTCRAHGRSWSLLGEDQSADGARSDLPSWPVRQLHGLVLAVPAGVADSELPLLGLIAGAPQLERYGESASLLTAVPWRGVVAHWLEVWMGSRAAARLGELDGRPQITVGAAGTRVDWQVALRGAVAPWSLARFSHIAGSLGETAWSRHFIAPNILVDRHAGGLVLMSVSPGDVATSRIDCHWFVARAIDPRRAALGYLATRLARPWLQEDLAILESLARAERGGRSFDPRPAAPGSALAALRAFGVDLG